MRSSRPHPRPSGLLLLLLLGGFAEERRTSGDGLASREPRVASSPSEPSPVTDPVDLRARTRADRGGAGAEAQSAGSLLAPSGPGDPSTCSKPLSIDGVNALPLSCPPFGEGASRSPPQPKDGLVLPESHSFADDRPECKDSLPTIEQGSCNACWAFSVAGLLSTRVCKARYRPSMSAFDVLSPQMALSCTAAELPSSNGCVGGGRPADALQWVADHYLLDQTCVPYRSTRTSDATDGELAKACPDMLRSCPGRERFTVSAAGYVIGDEEAMKRAIYKSGPIVSILRLSDSLYAFEGGEPIYGFTKSDGDRWSLEDSCDEKIARKRNIPGSCYVNGKDGAMKTRAMHVVLVYGWGVDPKSKEPYWIVRNWWGPDQYAPWGGDEWAPRYGGTSVRAAPKDDAKSGAAALVSKAAKGPFLRMKRGIDPALGIDRSGGLISNPSYLASVAAVAAAKGK